MNSIKLLLLLFLLGAYYTTFAQNPTTSFPTAVEQDTMPERKQVIVEKSKVMEGEVTDGKEINYLKGGVILRQGEVYLYCDSATMVDNNVVALGNVIIQQGDSLNIFADSLFYQGDDRIADLFGDVRLDNQGKRLFTDHLNYNLKTKRAEYFTRSLLTKDTTYLESNRGIYLVDTDQAFFSDSVVVIDTAFVMRTDSVDFSTASGILTFIAPTLIIQDESRIYCESGFYNTKNNYAEFSQNAEYIKEERQAMADVIIYDGEKEEFILNGNAEAIEEEKVATADVIRYEEKTKFTYLEGNAKYKDSEKEIEGDRIRYNSEVETFDTEGRSIIVDGSQILEADEVNYVGALGIATGNVIWIDTVDQITIESERIDYNKETDYVKASGGRPLLISVIDDDTLFMRSDTLVSLMENEADSVRTLIGYRGVRIFKSNLQAVCDSLVYQTKDSLFTFYQNPIVWSDTSQFYSDTVIMQMRNEEIDKIYLNNNAFIVNSPDEIYFNQIKGKNMTAFFKDDELQKMRVKGNAESIYYIVDEDDAYSGVNKCVCSSMLINFGDNEITDIFFYTNPTSNLFPMRKADHNALKLPGFKWDRDRRPKSRFDLGTIAILN